MLNKLIKHEFIATRRTIPMIAAVMFFFVGLYLLGDALELGWLIGGSLFFAVVAIAAMIIVTMLVLVMRLFKSLYGEEGYLTHTLPVTPGQILASKLIVSAIWLVACAALCILAGVLVLAPVVRDNPSLYQLWQTAVDWLNRIPGWQLTVLILVFGAVYLCNFLSQVTLAVTLGNMAANHKHSVAISVGLYLVINFVVGQISGLLALFVPPSLMFDAEGMHISGRNMFGFLMNLEQDVFTGMNYGIISFVFEFAAAAALVLAARRVMQKKLSIR